MPLDTSTAPPIAPARTGMLFIIAGPAGAGKNRLMKHVIEQGLARQLPTATTRSIRPGETEGREHLFVSNAEFESMIARGDLLEWQKVHDNMYGMHRPTLEAALDAGETIISDIDIYGANAARAALPKNVVVIFVQTPTIADLIDRMRIRGETTASIGLRLLRVSAEIEYAKECDAVITNDHIERAAEKLVTIVRAVLHDGRASAACDELITYRYNLHAQAIPVHEGAALVKRRAPEYPVVTFKEVEQPASAARRALLTTLPHITLAPEADPSVYRAPAVIDHRYDDTGMEIITYTYFVPVSERITPDEGWTWTSITP